MGKMYTALYDGTVTALRVQPDNVVEQGDPIAEIMWTDERGRSLTGGTTVLIRAPIPGKVRIYVFQGGRFRKGQPVFQVVRDTDPDY